MCSTVIPVPCYRVKQGRSEGGGEYLEGLLIAESGRVYLDTALKTLLQQTAAGLERVGEQRALLLANDLIKGVEGLPGDILFHRCLIFLHQAKLGSRTCVRYCIAVLASPCR